MKRGKDDEKIRGPMFPRLHVNDTADKGGPRAPPRNKMALYEQFSIPSQRFNSGGNPSGSSQGNGAERNIRFPVHQSATTPTHKLENYYYRHADEAESNASEARPQQRRKTGDEDDFVVPVFVQPGMDQDNSRNQSGMERGKTTPDYTVHTMQPNNCENPDNTRTYALPLRHKHELGNAGASKEASLNRQHSRKSMTNTGSRDHMHRTPQQTDPSTYQFLDTSGASMSQMSIPNACLQQNHRGRPQHEGSNGQNVDERIKSMEVVASPPVRSNSNSGEVDNDCEYHPEAPASLLIADANKSDDASDTSMVDSITGLEIAPEDVVAIIGQKRFWKARRAIANQQRAFSVQVFELHRLVKVQKLIAGSPNIMFEDASLFSKPSLKAFRAKGLASECVVRPSANSLGHKDSSEKPNYKMERMAENAVRASLSSVKKGTQKSNNLLHQADQPPMPMVADPKVVPWGFHQPYGHQWLIPVMSPSEGLIYKPYPGPGFVGTDSAGPGGCSPGGTTPFSCGYMNPYGYPPSHSYPGAPMGQNYFPTHSMQPISAPGYEQMNSCSPANLQGQSSQLSGARANSNLQPQNSSNSPTQQNGAIYEAASLQVSRECEQQGSAGSSHREREQGGTVPAAEEVGALSLFPLASGHKGGTQLGGVIKVVPHNPRSATESAARIFQSIQKERHQL